MARRCWGLWIVVATALLVSGCATDGGAKVRTGGKPRAKAADINALRSRATELWTARKDENWQFAFGFEDPSERKDWELVKYEEWQKTNFPFKVLSFQLGGVDADGDMGWVEVTYNSLVRRFPDVPPRDATMWQRWHRVDGTWYPVHPRDLDKYPEPPTRRDAAQEARLRARFLESFECRKTRNWKHMWELFDPRDRTDSQPDDVAELEAINEYRSCDVKWVEAINNQGRVRVVYERKVADPNLSRLKPMFNEEMEKWVLFEGEWYRDLK